MYQCLIDTKRVVAFKKAICRATSSKSCVVDLGSGSGIMGIFALEKGCKKLFSIEADPFLCKLLKKNLKGFRNAEIIQSDATQVEINEKADVVICEMIATGLFDECQIQATNNAHKFCKKNTTFIPSGIRSFIQIVEVKDIFLEKKISCVQYEYGWNKIVSKIISDRQSYMTLSFSKRNSINVDKTIKIKCKKNATGNALRISNTSFFKDSSAFDSSPAYCMPMYIPIKRIKIPQSGEVMLRIKYKMGKGLQNVKIWINDKRVF